MLLQKHAQIAQELGVTLPPISVPLVMPAAGAADESNGRGGGGRGRGGGRGGGRKRKADGDGETEAHAPAAADSAETEGAPVRYTRVPLPPLNDKLEREVVKDAKKRLSLAGVEDHSSAAGSSECSTHCSQHQGPGDGLPWVGWVRCRFDGGLGCSRVIYVAKSGAVKCVHFRPLCYAMVIDVGRASWGLDRA